MFNTITCLICCLLTDITAGFEKAGEVKTTPSSIVVVTNRCFDYDLNDFVQVTGDTTQTDKAGKTFKLGNTCTYVLQHTSCACLHVPSFIICTTTSRM